MKLNTLARALTAASLATSMTAPAWAGTPFDHIRLGDRDGFGYTNTTGLQAASGAPADTNGNGLLEQTEFLPDLNRDGSVCTGCGDDFDHRSPAEIADSVVSGHGFTDQGSSGSKWTDISLSTSFTGPNFPDPSGPKVPNSPVFTYKFHVDADAITAGSPMFFNLLYGDYEVGAAQIDLSFASAAGRTVTMKAQPAGADGLIQAASTTLSFDELFTADPNGGWSGYLVAKVVDPTEPYNAWDYGEVSLKEVSYVPEPIDPIDPPTPAVPEPETWALMLGGLGVLGALARRRSRPINPG